MKSIVPSMIAVFSLVLVLAASWGWQPAGTVLAAEKDVKLVEADVTRMGLR
jgi:hypothetical protein